MFETPTISQSFLCPSLYFMNLYIFLPVTFHLVIFRSFGSDSAPGITLIPRTLESIAVMFAMA